jgi:hypothetical protein
LPLGTSKQADKESQCPRDWAQQVANIQFWREYDVGGHFSSLECPELFVRDMRQFFSQTPIQKAFRSLD